MKFIPQNLQKTYFGKIMEFLLLRKCRNHGPITFEKIQWYSFTGTVHYTLHGGELCGSHLTYLYVRVVQQTRQDLGHAPHTYQSPRGARYLQVPLHHA